MTVIISAHLREMVVTTDSGKYMNKLSYDHYEDSIRPVPKLFKKGDKVILSSAGIREHGHYYGTFTVQEDVTNDFISPDLPVYIISDSTKVIRAFQDELEMGT